MHRKFEYPFTRFQSKLLVNIANICYREATQWISYETRSQLDLTSRWNFKKVSFSCHNVQQHQTTVYRESFASLASKSMEKL